MKIDLEQYIDAFSDTVDLVGVDETQHVQRVAFMAREYAIMLGNKWQELTFYDREDLLHDCGISSTRVHKNRVNQIDWVGSAAHYDLCGSDGTINAQYGAVFSSVWLLLTCPELRQSCKWL